MSRSTLDLPAGRIHYREVGPADGRPVVFVHGFLVDGELWADVPDRLAERGLRCLVPTWPLGSHTEAMRPDADLSPRGVARVVTSFLETLDLADVTLVGSDTGGAVSQLVLDEDASRIGRLVLTNCDAFDTFPPFPFDVLFRAARRPGVGRALLQTMRVGRLRTSRLGFGWLVHRDLSAAETLPWVTPYLADAGVRRDVAAFCRAWTGSELEHADRWLSRFDEPVLLVWSRRDPFFKLALAERLAATFPDVRLVPVDDALTFVSLDQPALLAEEIAAHVV
jgi:pimeloyl-ACP methyl ester carboxylesterase